MLLTLLLIPLLLARISSEEKLLRVQFGDEYNAYCARTWRLIPGMYSFGFGGCFDTMPALLDTAPTGVPII